jgi:hypothetical protein
MLDDDAPPRLQPAPSPRAAPRRPTEPGSDEPVLAELAARIDWSTLGTTLATGSLVGVDVKIARLLRQASSLTPVRKAAKRVGVSALLLVVGLLARAAAAHDLYADRVARAVLGRASVKTFSRAAKRLGLSV